ncbi:hypothetical protein WJX82_003319 [Trebouxia sp. C0006]
MIQGRQMWGQQVLSSQGLLALTASAREPPQATHSASPDKDAQTDQFLPAIVLAFFASQNRSLLAAECLIETVVEMYRRGMQLDSLQFALSMATLQSGSTLLSEQELDILTARCGIIMLTLHEVGCAVYPKAQGNSEPVQHKQQEEPLNEQSKRLTRGLGRFVQQIVNMYKSGFDSRRMLLQQSLAGVQGGEPGDQGEESPSVVTMQQNTRLVVLTLEMIQHSSIPITSPLQSTSPQENYSSSDSDRCLDKRKKVGLDRSQMLQRPLKQQDLIALVHSLLNQANPYRTLAEFMYYREGWTAQQLFDQLIQDEFVQTGGLLPLNPRIKGGRDTPPHLTAELFARWLSTAYMTLAVMGVPHPHASQQLGWAWVTLPLPPHTSSPLSPSQNSLQAHRLAEIVANKLRLEEEEDYRRQGQQLEEEVSESAKAMRDISAFQLMTQSDGDQAQEQYVVLEDPALQHTSTGYNVVVQQLELVLLTRAAVMQSHKASTNV